MAMAGVAWTAGREASSAYRESLAPDQADNQLQAYNFRFIMTRDPKNRVTPQAPVGYRRDDFVGVLEALQSEQIRRIFDYPSRCIFKAQTPPLPNGKYDINDVSRNLVRLSLPGRNTGWPNGSSEQRRKIWLDHMRDQAGLLYFLQNDEAVPKQFQAEAREWGWCRDEFTETDHLPPQLYVREARRMIGQHVYVQHDSEHAPGDARARLHRDSIAMSDYGNNCHGTFHEGPRFGGRHTGEFYNPVPPYQIPYGVLVPRETENLLVPAAASSSHVGFCALRLEPVWMSLGQAAGHAASIAVAQKLAVQQISVRQLQQRLHAAGSATIYVSDVLPGDPDFAAVQWWGLQGGLHGLQPMPPKPGQRGIHLHGQYYGPNPGHAAELNTVLDEATARRWLVIAELSGLAPAHLPSAEDAARMTRGDFVRFVYERARSEGLIESDRPVAKLHSAAEPNTHAPGEVDVPELVAKVVQHSALLPGIVLDDSDAILVGEWQYSSHTPPFVGRGYLHDMKSGKGEKSVTWIPEIPEAGRYEVRVSHCYNVRRSINTPVTVHSVNGEETVVINQQHVPEHGELFRTLGTWTFAAGRENWIRISTDGTDGKYVISDAVQLIRVETDDQ
ncbi:MAG: FAD-dependent oxidoreductase, partial [Planctomycetaceae bacterium]|nr:FAD-dependent oxidoreductase [Planctomycetaceae bacterium]